MELLIGALLITAGYMLCYFTVKKPIQHKETYAEVKRIKPSFRNPTKPYNVAYEKYKAKDSDLYGAVKPKGGES